MRNEHAPTVDQFVVRLIEPAQANCGCASFDVDPQDGTLCNAPVHGFHER